MAAAAQLNGLSVAVDATCWSLYRGFGRQTRCLLRALLELDTRHRYTLFVDRPEVVEQLPAGARARLVRTTRPTTAAAAADSHRSLRDIVAMSRALSREGADVILFPTLYSYVPVFGRARTILMIHDVGADAHPALTIGGGRARLFWRLKSLMGRRQADVLATVSEYSRRALIRQFGIPASRVHVVGEAGDAAFRPIDRPEPTPRLRALGLDGPERVVVYVGGFSPHKNVDVLVEAFGRLAADSRFGDLRLVLVGDHQGETFLTVFEGLRRRIDGLGLGDRVLFTGYLADEDLAVLLNRSTVLVLPSLFEGFGLPAVEAAACGCPVIATTESPLPELLGDAALYVRPRRSDELEHALQLVLDSPERRRRMREAGLDAAAALTWEAAARQLLALIEGSVSGRSPGRHESRPAGVAEHGP